MDEGQTKTVTTSSSSRSVNFHGEYLRTVPGILKIVEMVLDLIVIICIAIPTGVYTDWEYRHSRGWTYFVSTSALITTALYFIFHILNLVSRLPGPQNLIEFIYTGVVVLLYAIVGIVCAVAAGGPYYSYMQSFGAAAAFAFFAAVAYGVECFFQYRIWKSGTDHTVQTTTTTTTTNTY